MHPLDILKSRCPLRLSWCFDSDPRSPDERKRLGDLENLCRCALRIFMTKKLSFFTYMQHLFASYPRVRHLRTKDLSIYTSTQRRRSPLRPSTWVCSKLNWPRLPHCARWRRPVEWLRHPWARLLSRADKSPTSRSESEWDDQLLAIRLVLRFLL